MAGYPGPTAAALDPLIGRGYLIGKVADVAAGTLNQGLINHGLQDHFFRWKVTLSVVEKDGVAYGANRAYCALFEIMIKSENERIRRRCAVPLAGGQVIYAPGRSIEVYTSNPTNQTLSVQVGLDEATPGLSSWKWFEDLSAIDAETALDIPEFCDSFHIQTPMGSAGFTVRGYDLTGAMAFEEVLATPSSREIYVNPGLAYTVQNVGPGTQSGVVYYRCVG